MGVHNRQRRADKARKRAKARPRGQGAGHAPWYAHEPSGGAYGSSDGDLNGGTGPSPSERAVAAQVLLQAVTEVELDVTAATRQAAALTAPSCRARPKVLASVAEHLLASLLGQAVRSGWGPEDLAEIARRRLTSAYLPALTSLMHAEADRHQPDRVATAWRDQLDQLGPALPAELSSLAGMELALGLCALLGQLPAIEALVPPPGTSTGGAGRAGGPDAKRLATVRALLAKAESTQYDEEAEALSTKAQELISRYALDRLVDRPELARERAAVAARRLWIDAPYVVAKAMLINAVAGANRCRTVMCDHLGFSTVVGEPADLDAVELMSTSLLVQADTAMLRHGRLADHTGTSRTRSFRRSFLISYASRIGERLRAATAEAAEATGRSGELVPVLRRQQERVDRALGEMFPETTLHQTTITNRHGWAAGRAAADLALFDTRGGLSQAAS